MARTPLADLLRRAIALHRAGQPEAAEVLYRDVLRRAPGQHDANLLLGELLFKRGAPAEARGLVEVALRTRPRDPDALNLLGSVLGELGQPDAALACFDRALAERPGNAEALYNRASTLMDANRLAEALSGFDAALARAPERADAHLNRGMTLRALGRPREAVVAYARAAALDFTQGDAPWYETLCRLLLGEFERGWHGYERRWRMPRLGGTGGGLAGEPGAGLALEPPDTGAPLWLGREPLAGRTILLHAEQGFGDTIQFCRYAPMVAAAGGRVVLEAPPELHTLLASLAGVDRLVAPRAPRPAEALQTPLLSLPLAFRTRLDSIPAAVPYLRAPAAAVARWGARPPSPSGRRRVGVVWAGNPRFRHDRERSVPLARFARIFAAPCDFVVLQTAVNAPDRALLAACPNVSLIDADRGDFADTAALVGTVDLVVSVDTAVAHLAGALGAPVWLLLPLAADWRWLTEREDSPWYPTMRLFRQAVGGDWDGVLERVAAGLSDTDGPRA